MHKVYELKEALCDELEEYGNKGKLTAGDIEIVDKLAHTIKNLDKIIETYEEDGYSEDDYAMERGGYSNEGNYSNARDGMGRYSRRYSMARNGRGRGSNARRDSMGRYSSDNGMMVEELRELMKDAPDERSRMEFEKFIRKMETM